MEDLLDIHIPPEKAKPGIRYMVTAVEYAVILVAFNQLNSRRDPSEVLNLIFIAIWIIYFPVIEGITGQTLGKKLAGIKVLKKDYSRINFFHSFIRRFTDVVDFLPMFGLLGFIIALTGHNHQRIGDMLAGTIVVKV